MHQYAYSLKTGSTLPSQGAMEFRQQLFRRRDAAPNILLDRP